MEEDPIGFDGGDVNLYRYVWNSSSNFIDPMGDRVYRPQAFLPARPLARPATQPRTIPLLGVLLILIEPFQMMVS
jgi:hypothetical protein